MIMKFLSPVFKFFDRNDRNRHSGVLMMCPQCSLHQLCFPLPHAALEIFTLSVLFDEYI